MFNTSEDDGEGGVEDGAPAPERSLARTWMSSGAMSAARQRLARNAAGAMTKRRQALFVESRLGDLWHPLASHFTS